MKCPGRRPYGSTQKQRDVIRQIKLWRRPRRDGTVSSYAAIARRLDGEKIPGPGGGAWTARAVRTVSTRKFITDCTPDNITKRTLHAGDYLTAEQLGKCLRACPARDRLIFEVLLGTGMRPKVEFCALQVRDVAVTDGAHQIDVRRGKRRIARSIIIDQELAGMLRNYLQTKRRGAKRRDPLFLDSRGNALSYKALHGRLKNLGEKAGVGRLNPYRLRHSFGTIIYGDRKDLFFVADQMGHKRVETTRIYAHVPETEKKSQMEGFRRYVRKAENVRKYPENNQSGESEADE